MNKKHDELFTTEEKTHVFSQEHEQKMAAIFEAARQNEKTTKGESTSFPHKKSKTIVKKVCMVAAVIIVLSTMASASFWDDLRYWLHENFGTFSEMDADNNENVMIEGRTEANIPLPEDWVSCWVPRYLPEGYSFDSTLGTSTSKQIHYNNDAGELLEIYQHEGQNDFQQDTEGDAKNVQIGHSTGYYLEKQVGESTIGTLLWSVEETSFKISGIVSYDEMVMIAESMVLIEQ